MLIDEAEDVDDAEHERLLAKAEAEGITPDVRGVSRDGHDATSDSTRVDTLGMWDVTLGLPRAGRARPRPRSADGSAGCPSRGPSTTSSCSAWAAAGSPATCWPPSPGRPARCRSSWSRTTSCRASSARARWSSRCRSRATPRRRSTARPRRLDARRPPWSRCRPGGALAELAEDAGGVALRPRRRHPDAPRRARRAGRCRSLVVLEDVGLFPGARGAGRGRGRAAAPPRATLLARPGNPAAALARTHRPHVPLVYGGGRPRRRWPPALEEPGQRERQGAGLRHTLPELCHNEICGWGQHGDVTRQVLTLVELRHDFEHRRVARRFELMDDQMLEVVGEICTRRGARGTGRWPSCSTSCWSAT